MTDMIPDWFKVKLAAVTGVGTPWLASFLDHLGPVLEVAIKLGQVGVAVVTVLYIYAKWRQVRSKKK